MRMRKGRESRGIKIEKNMKMRQRKQRVRDRRINEK